MKNSFLRLEVKMKRFFVVISIIVLFCLLPGNTKLFAEKLNNGPMKLQLTETTSIQVNVPKTWSVSVDKKSNFIFKNLQTPDKIEITVTNIAIDYTEDSDRLQRVHNSKEGSHKGIMKNATPTTKVERSDGLDTILGQEIPWGLWTVTEQGKTIYLKSLYPYNNKQLFLMFITFQDGAPFDQAEALIEELVSSFQKSGM